MVGWRSNDFDTAQREKAIELTKPIEDAIRAEIGDEVVNLFYDGTVLSRNTQIEE